MKSSAKVARVQLKRSRYEEEDEDEEEEEKDNEQAKKHPMMISEDEDEGEYIEDLGGIDFAATDTSESQLESPEEENVRKSSRKYYRI